MSTSIHPPLKLKIVLEENSFTGDIDAEIERRFTAVAPVEVVRAPKGSQRVNVLIFQVGKSALDKDNDPLWHDALATWLDETFSEVSALIARENDARRNNDKHTLRFSWVEVRFEGEPVIALRMINSAIPPAAAGFVERARALLKEKAFGVDAIEVVRIPACVSISAQRGEPTRAEIDETLAQAEDALQQNGDAPAKDSFKSDDVPHEVDMSGESCALSNEEVPADLDYRIWNVAYVDGTSVRFDSVLGEVILD